ncbi:hypothetical protein WAF17_03480 [Bernardetia sp. ABR2-2B]|uniref:hypothetical protein n=1 Tax=Bernardetia sp. ABR2-2B TaxID=3127472 RepID=UPI0030CB516A
MIPLEEKYWKKFSNPYGSSDELPALLQQLDNHFEQELFDTICWEYIYHQGSLYQSTIAAFPYLLKIITKEENRAIQLDAYTSLGVIIAVLYENEVHLNSIIEDDNYKLDNEIKQNLYISFKESYKSFFELLPQFIDEVKKIEEAEKRYFLSLIALSKKSYFITDMLITFNGNDEYMSICPNCNSEFHLWNEEDKLNGYIKDPVFEKKQTPFVIIPKHIDRKKATIQSDNYQEWMVAYIDLLEIDSLKEIITFLFGDIICPTCKSKYYVFPSVCHS